MMADSDSTSLKILKLIYDLFLSNILNFTPFLGLYPMGKVVFDCWQSVAKLSFSTEMFCQKSETSRVDATVLRYRMPTAGKVSSPSYWSTLGIIYRLLVKHPLPAVGQCYHLQTFGTVSVKCPLTWLLYERIDFLHNIPNQ